ncbi:long-chain fatty acid--CoA ligase [Miltoncostaea oceani]|uniref:long-chain fatty acid--CoA ligase n=1 Tax=Miltoncostaea oceani TaxID=2843216 RepID=UPI0031B9DA49
MMDGPLTLGALLARAETIHPTRPVVSLTGGGGARRSTYGEVVARARRLAAGLRDRGIGPGDRVATLCMNHDRHLETYFAVALMGGVLHTLNPRLPVDDLAYIAADAGDRMVVADAELGEVLAALRGRVPLEHVAVVGDGVLPDGAVAFEDLLAPEGAPSAEVAADERDAVVLCYTSGTTGRPKGVLYSHRALVLHSLAGALGDAFDIREADVVMPVVPMFHVNAWGLPFTCPMVGAALVLPGRHLDPASLLAAVAAEGVTVTAGVPTVWLGMLAALDADPGAHDVSSLRTVIIGGSAPPRSLMEGLEARHGIRTVQAWGMTELSPLGTISRLPPDVPDDGSDDAWRRRGSQGRPIPFVEIRARGAEGLVPWDGVAMGELEVRGPWVASGYHGADDGDRVTPDGWFRTGDVVTIDPRGFVQITDREKDLVKSGGEWISSVALENALMDHPAVAEAAVVAVPHPEWLERPLACVVLAEGASAGADELVAHLATRFPRWWLPDAVEFIDAIPRTATGKFRKADLRERFGGGA